MRRRDFDSSRLGALKRQRSQLKVREAGLRARLVEVESALKDVEEAITREDLRRAVEGDSAQTNESQKIKALLEQNVDPALIATSLRIPRKRVAAIVEEEASRWRA